MRSQVPPVAVRELALRRMAPSGDKDIERRDGTRVTMTSGTFRLSPSGGSPRGVRDYRASNRAIREAAARARTQGAPVDRRSREPRDEPLRAHAAHRRRQAEEVGPPRG